MLLKDIKTDPEFKERLRQQTPDEADAMRRSIDQSGYINPLIVWKDHGVLVDGHHRFADWQRRQAEYEAAKPKGFTGMLKGNQPKQPPQPDFIQMEFKDRNAVLDFIDVLQYAKRNLTESEMAYLRARFISRAKGTMTEADAVKLSAETHGISERTARRDAQLATDCETLDPIVKAATGKTMAQVMSSTEAPDRKTVKEAAKLAETDPQAAVVSVQRSAKDKRCKPRTDAAQAPKPPAWERHLVLLTQALEALWKDSVDEERKAVKSRLGVFVKHIQSLDSVSAA